MKKTSTMKNLEKNKNLYKDEFMDLLVKYRLSKDINEATRTAVELINWIQTNYE